MSDDNSKPIAGSVSPAPVSSEGKPTKAAQMLDLSPEAFDAAKVQALVAYDELKKANAKAISIIKKAEDDIQKCKDDLTNKLNKYRKEHNIHESHIDLDTFIGHLKSMELTARSGLRKASKKAKSESKKITKKAKKAAASGQAVALQKAEAVRKVILETSGDILGPDFTKKVQKAMGKKPSDMTGAFFRPVVDGYKYVLNQTKDAGEGAAKYIDKAASKAHANEIIEHFKKKK